MAGVLRHHGRARISLASVLVLDLSPAKASWRSNDPGRKDLHQRRDEIQTSMGLWPGEISHRSRLVVLSILAADVPDGRAPLFAVATRQSANDCLQYFGDWRGDGRRCFRFSDEARADGWQGAQDDDAVLRHRHAGVHAGRRGSERAIRRLAIWPG